MQYRNIGDSKVSVLGFGCMRLPVIDGDEGRIDEKKTAGLFHSAIEKGINYFDTAYPYHKGTSETVAGKALAPYRDKIFIATKLPSWQVKEPEDCEKLLNEQLEKLGTDYIDFYLLHALKKDWWKSLKENKALEFLDKALKEGKIRYAGFSFHGELNVFKDIIDGYDWSFCQIQYNYMDERIQAGTVGLKYAAEKNIPIVVMEPLRGGSLTREFPKNIKELAKDKKVERSPADLALRWLLDKKEIACILSGMNSQAQLEENCSIVETAIPGCLSEAEKAVIKENIKFLREKTKVPCTACNYCMPCPAGVNIPRIFAIYNDFSIYGDGITKATYNFTTNESEKAPNCVECGLCEGKCPQSIPIIEKLKESHKALTS